MENPEELDDFITIDLQPRQAVIDRLSILHAFVERSMLEAVTEVDGGTSEIEERRFDLLAELLSSHAADSLIPEELEIMQMPIGQIPDDQQASVILSAEAFGLLGKACGLIRELPLPPNPVGSSEELLESILAMTPEEIAEHVQLPAEEEAATMLEVAEVIHWRADVEFGARLDGGQLTEDEKESILAVGAEAERSGLATTYPSGDLRIGNKPIRKWTDDEVETFYIVSLQQRIALEWLCTAGQTWTILTEEDDD
ncbi:MAG: DUF4272 domain-containing protein [Thermomicrobiales bacterium]|nr:DUF4272 domain-containing protein [Thermomicrobiales bacterium]